VCPHFRTLAFQAQRRKLGTAVFPKLWGNMELAVVIVVVVVAGALIPGSPKIHFFR
jgi:hypothetical protein